MSDITQLETAGSTSFARCGEGQHRLFSVNSHVPATVALEYAATLQNCAGQLMLDAAVGEGERHITWAAFYIGEMAAAIIEDVSVHNAALL